MAPTSVDKKEGPVATQGSRKTASEVLNGRRRAATTKSKTRKGHASRAHGMRKIVGRGLGVAMKAYAIAKKGAKLGGFGNMVSDALVSTTRTLLGVAGRELTGRRYEAGLKLEYKKGEGGTECNVSLNLCKTPKGGDGRQFNSMLRFKSPVDACGRTPSRGEHQQEGTARHTTLTPYFSRSRIDDEGRLLFSPLGLDFLAMGRGPAARPNSRSSLLVQFDPLNSPRIEPASPPFETIPLGNLETQQQPHGRIKSENIKQEVPW